MFYHLLYSLRDVISPFNVVKYITFRAAASFITAFLITFLIAPRIIDLLKRRKKLQVIRSDGPEKHKEKQGTPTMGGIIILISLMVSVLLWARLDNRFIILLIISTVWLGGLGFIDDYMTVSRNSSKGVVPTFKIIWQVILGLAVAVYLYFNPSFESQAYSLALPFFKNMFINLGSLYILFVIMTVVGTSNAVNITDGLDGLAVGGIFFASLTYALLAYIAGHANFSEYLFLPYIRGAGEVSVYLTALAGAGLGFLWFNIFPFHWKKNT